MKDGDENSASPISNPGDLAEDWKFDSWRSFWNFQREASRHRRYIRTPEADRFLAAIRMTAQMRVRDIPEGWIGWRAALAHDGRYDAQIDDEIPCAAKPERMRPWPDKATEGRVNSKGIPCLYLATERETAMSEVRPWVGSLVSVARFQTVRPLRVVDCSLEWNSLAIHFEEPSYRERVKAVWAHIDKAFAEPTSRSDDVADYAPTQILAEVFRDQDYDGVVYKSVFGDKGYNIALFDLSAAIMLTCGLFKAKKAAYEFVQQDDEYFIQPPNTAPEHQR